MENSESICAPLLALQEIDMQIIELMGEVRDIPARKSSESERLRAAELALAAASSELRAIQTKAADFELQAKQARDTMAKLRKQQLELKTNKEFQAMDLEIRAAAQDAEHFDEEQVSSLDDVPAIEARVAAAKARVAEEKATVADYLAELDQRLAEANARLEELKAERAEARKNVNPRHLAVYEHLIKSRRPAVVPLKNGICGGCHLLQPPSVQHAIRHNDRIVACSMCSRILY